MDLTPEHKAFMKEVFARQKEGCAFLEQEQIENIRKTDTETSLQALSGLTRMAMRTRPPQPYSGLQEFCAAFIGKR